MAQQRVLEGAFTVVEQLEDTDRLIDIKDKSMHTLSNKEYADDSSS
jgi:hypothetical protein